ncbi:MAG TPA: 2OG-Fe(II) oxygenase [Gammaproteobacteria bacterium]|nr:2OG-Fe(II) oxygenase [Gammaproteobacteria bacterium]
MGGAVAAAAEHDAAGRHDEAIDALALATQAGDLEATVSLGLRLLVGDRAPYLPNEGIRFLSDAVLAGSTEAALRLAPLAGLGAHVAQDWGHALGLLVIAAERGSEDARGQLRTLATRRDGSIEAGDDWRRLAESIDWRLWLAPPDGVTVHESPLVRSFPELVTGAVCDWLRGRALGRLRRALIYDPGEGGNVADHMRTNSLAGFDLADVDLVQVALQHRMAAACGVPVQNTEGPTILRYSPGEQITNHFDFVNPRLHGYEQHVEQRGERIITFLVYLNDDYEGGETDFPRVGVRHRGHRREGLFFTNALPSGKPDYRMVHAGLPPLSGEKWIVSQFFRSRTALNTRAENVG